MNVYIFAHAPQIKRGILLTILPIFQKHSESHFAPKDISKFMTDKIKMSPDVAISGWKVGRASRYVVLCVFHVETIIQYAVKCRYELTMLTTTICLPAFKRNVVKS